MSRVYEAWRRTSAATSEEMRPVEGTGAGVAAVESDAASGEPQRPATAATSLFPLRESLAQPEVGDDGQPAQAWPVVPDSKSRNLTFEQLIRDIAIDEQRMNL